MDEEYQRMAANSIAHEAFCAGQAWQRAAAAQERPCVLWKPSLFRDGNQWCALFGENIQEGVVGFGDSPDAAMWAFDEAWRETAPPAPCAHPAPSVPEDVMRDAERYRYLRARDDGTAGVGCWIEAEGRACDRGWLYGDQLDSVIDTCIEMLAAAPEAKP